MQVTDILPASIFTVLKNVSPYADPPPPNLTEERLLHLGKLVDSGNKLLYQSSELLCENQPCSASM